MGKSGCIDYNEFVEDLKSQDMQTGGFLGGDKPVASKKAPAEVSFSHPTPTTSTGASGRSGRSILQQIAEKVEQKAKNVRVVFRNFDEDKSGSVDYAEFRRGLAHLGIAMSDEDFKTLIDLVDNDKSGCIDYNEFVEDLKSQDMQTGGFLGGDKPVASKKAPAEVSFSHPTPTTSTGASGRSGRSILQQIAEKVEQK